MVEMKDRLALVYPKAITLFLGALFLILVFFSFVYNGYSSVKNQAVPVSEAKITVAGEEYTTSLPTSVKNAPHGSEVTVAFMLPTHNGDNLFFGTVYSPLRIYANGSLIYFYGDKQSYPKFFLDPPTQYDSINLPYSEDGSLNIEMVYNIPNERDSLSVHAPIVGNGNAMLNYLIRHHGITWIISVFFLFLGALLVCMFPFFLGWQNRGRAFLLPGLLSLFAGMWQFGENTLSVYLFQMPSVLYVIDFIGLFLMVIPIYKLSFFIENLKRDKLLKIVLIIIEISAILAMSLQLLGIVSLHRSLFAFHIIVPVSLAILTLRTLYEYVKYKEKGAGLLCGAYFILTLSAILELLNFHIKLIPQFSSIFQTGLFIFIIAMAVFSGKWASNLITYQIRNMEMENELKLSEQAIESQKLRNRQLLTHFEDIKKQRHDIRHHLRAIYELIQNDDKRSALEYITTVTDSIPTYSQENYCDNTIVNSVIAFYEQTAKNNHIRIKINVQVPYSNKHISDSSLCVIFGNLLENAVEACERMNGNNRYISLISRVNGDMLFITMENSYEGNIQRSGDKFYSSKHKSFGIGITSVKSLAERHNGSAEFKILNNCFQSNVCVRL